MLSIGQRVVIQTDKLRVSRSFLAKDLAVGLLTHEHKVVHVHLADAIHAHRALGAVRILEREGIPHRYTAKARQALGDDRTVAVEREALAALALAQIHVLTKSLVVIGHEQRDLLLIALGAGRLGQRLVGCGGRARHSVVSQQGIDVSALGVVHVVLLGHNQVVADDLAELLAGNAANGVLNREAREEHGYSARDAKDRHGRAPLVAEKVAHGDLAGKAQAAPNEAHMLKQNLRAACRGLGQQERCRLLGNLATGCQPCGGNGHKHRQCVAGKGHERIEMQLKRGHGELGRVGVVNDVGQQRVAQNHAQRTAECTRGGTVDHELLLDVGVAVAKRLERAGVDALLVDHARHRGRRNKGCHQVQEVREDVRERINDFRDRVVGLVALGARDLAAVVDAVGGRLELGQSLLGIGQVGLAIGDLLFSVGQGIVVLGQTVLVLGLLLGEFSLGRLDLLLGGVVLAGLGGKGCRSGLPAVETRVVGRKALVIGSDTSLVGDIALVVLGLLGVKRLLGPGKLLR